jgi:hypothetical protein
MNRRVRAFFTSIPLLCAVPIAHANTLTVTSFADSGAGTLRDAIASASSGDTIVFASDMAIVLASELTLNKDLTIDGSGRSVAVVGGNGVRAFYVNSGVVAQIKHLTLQNGNVTAANGFGGAIYNDANGTLTLTDCTLAYNAAYHAGAIFNIGTLSVVGSTLYGNSAQNSGGAIYNTAGTLTVTNSTFANNSASADAGAVLNVGGTATSINSTFAGNSAANGMDVYGTTSITLINTIIADGCAGTIADGGGNLDSSTSCGFPAANSNIDPRLGPLQDNGGPTWTMAPLFGSPVVDAIDCTQAPPTDQRGIARPQGAKCDIGAVESDRIFGDGFGLPPSHQ